MPNSASVGTGYARSRRKSTAAPSDAARIGATCQYTNTNSRPPGSALSTTARASGRDVSANTAAASAHHIPYQTTTASAAAAVAPELPRRKVLAKHRHCAHRIAET